VRTGTLLVRRNEIHSEEPLLQRNLRVGENRINGTTEIMLALRAAVATVLHLRAMMLAAVGGDDVVSPACLCQCLLADAVCSEVLCH
jgi:hypothetical protein